MTGTPRSPWSEGCLRDGRGRLRSDDVMRSNRQFRDHVQILLFLLSYRPRTRQPQSPYIPNPEHRCTGFALIVVGAMMFKGVTKVNWEDAGEAIPGLLNDIVVTHVLRSEHFDDPADLARLPAVSRAMRDAVAATGRHVALTFLG